MEEVALIVAVEAETTDEVGEAEDMGAETIDVVEGSEVEEEDLEEDAAVAEMIEGEEVGDMVVVEMIEGEVAVVATEEVETRETAGEEASALVDP